MSLFAVQVYSSTLFTTTSTSKSTIPNSLYYSENIGTLSLQLMGSTATRKQLGAGTRIKITMRDRSKNRKPLQKGRNLSIEAIQTVQALKRTKGEEDSVRQVFASNFSRLLRLDMLAVLRELLRQNQCLLAIKAFEDMQKEHWYKPRVLLYAELISVLGSNGMFDKVELIFRKLKTESSLEPDSEGFNAVLKSLMGFNIVGLAMECFYLMKAKGCEPDRTTFKILINGLESNGETSLSASVRQEAEKYYGKSLEFLEVQEDMAMS